jgi:hypothetical protein
VNWIQSTQTVVGTRGSRTIRLTVGQAVGYVNGRSVRLDAPAQVIAGRVFVPLRFIHPRCSAAAGAPGGPRQAAGPPPENGITTVPTTVRTGRPIVIHRASL